MVLLSATLVIVGAVVLYVPVLLVAYVMVAPDGDDTDIPPLQVNAVPS